MPCADRRPRGPARVARVTVARVGRGVGRLRREGLLGVGQRAVGVEVVGRQEVRPGNAALVVRDHEDRLQAVQVDRGLDEGGLHHGVRVAGRRRCTRPITRPLGYGERIASPRLIPAVTTSSPMRDLLGRVDLVHDQGPAQVADDLAGGAARRRSRR